VIFNTILLLCSITAILIGLGTHLFVKVPRWTFSVFESSCHLFLPV